MCWLQEDEGTSEFALDGLKQVMAVKSRSVLPYLVPKVSSIPEHLAEQLFLFKNCLLRWKKIKLSQINHISEIEDVVSKKKSSVLFLAFCSLKLFGNFECLM